MLILKIYLSLLTIKYLFLFISCVILSKNEIFNYRERVKNMFYHAYNNYIENAFEYDELKPISCSGINTWGNFHLTIIDSLDTLILMKNYTEYNRVVDYIIKNINFDYDLNVSVFETNIRIVGGLLSAHLLSYKTGITLEKGWPCKGPLLRLAEKVATKLLPAFDTPTGMPFGTVNLLNSVPFNETPITCTAGIGTFILEFGTLSRLTGNKIFENVALRAIESLHSFRSKIDLVGNHINITDGTWIATDSSIGGGVDSYFEYLVKGSILFKMPKLLNYFNVYYSSINKYMKNDDWHLAVNMNTGRPSMAVFQSLESFWPGLLTLIGNLNDAKKIFLNNQYVWKQFGFLPEFYDLLKFDIKQNGYPLRPEHVESIFYLYKSTKDKNYLNYAIQILESIEYSSKTDCGYATIKDVQNHLIEDKMESFFISETLKYLYLIFDEDNFIYNDGSKGLEITYTNDENENHTCLVEAGGYVFNTEAHPIDASFLDCCFEKKKMKNIFVNNLFSKTDFPKFNKKLTKFNFFKLKNDKKEKYNFYNLNNYNKSNSLLNLIDSFEENYENLICNSQHFLLNFVKYNQVLKKGLI